MESSDGEMVAHAAMSFASLTDLITQRTKWLVQMTFLSYSDTCMHACMQRVLSSQNIACYFTDAHSVTVYFMQQLKVLTTWQTGNSIFTLSMSFRVKYATINKSMRNIIYMQTENGKQLEWPYVYII